MRVLIVDTYYPAFLARHYAEHPELRDAPYAEQLAALMARRFGTSDAYSTGLRSAGHEAWEVVPNCGELQGAWAREHGVRRSLLRRRGFLHRVVFEQVRRLDPDVVYLQDLWFFSRAELDRLRADGRMVVGQIASEAPPPERLQGFDLIVTSFPHYVERFRALGVGSEYFPIAFDDRVLEEVETEGDRPYGVVSVGGVNPRTHPGGTALLERLADRLDLQVWGYGADDLAAGSPLRARHHGE